jgi:P-type Cu+ transporter
METVNWKVEGMTCSSCVLTINKFLEKQGMQNVKVNLAGGDVSFDLNGNTAVPEIEKGIEGLGYKVVKDISFKKGVGKKPMNKFLRYLLICLPFTLLLILPMTGWWRGWQGLMNPWLQLTLCLPVYILGMLFFGRSGINSVRNGMPNMNLLVAIGATAAFVYSLVGTLLNLGEGYLFYETAAAIITLIFLGNYLEDITIHSTQHALNNLARSQKVMANMIAFDEEHREILLPVENSELRSGDLVLIKSGEQVPADCKILWGSASIDESIITGESLPLDKNPKDILIGGSLLLEGTVKAQVSTASKDSVLSNIVNLVKRAQGEKPPVQQLADRISAVFVPAVLGIALLTLVANGALLHQLTPSLMRCIAVLVIACPCAMGLATPAAVAVGLGRAARNGVLFRNAKSLELFKDIRQVVFDKTGTLTNGKFRISKWQLTKDSLSEPAFKQLAFSLEKYSNHPVAKCIVSEWKSKDELKWTKLDEIKGFGIKAISPSGDEYWAGSFKIAGKYVTEDYHNVYIVKNNILLGWIDVTDELRPESKAVIDYLHSKNIATILLSGDRLEHCQRIASELGIDEVIAEQTPEQKLDQVAYLSARRPTAMVGDGINDAPALAKATIGISMSDASQLAIQTADLVLVNKGLKNLPLAMGLGRHTFMTIQQNLFWAFFYNVIAIPVAAFGFLTPALAALAMALSDILLLFNSIRLYIKKVL